MRLQASASDCQNTVSRRLTASFMFAPAPIAPINSTLRHSCSSSGCASENASRVPAAKPNSVPSRAGFTVPLTGHSSNSAPLASTLGAKARCSLPRTVLISTKSLRATFADSSPSWPV